MLNPNYKTISPLTEAFNIEHEFNIGNPALLSFQIPYLIEIRNKLIENPTVSKIKERFVVKFIRRQRFEYFLIKKITIKHDDSGDYLSIECVGTSVQLADKLIDSYSAESKNASYLLNDVLSISSWGKGSIDASFDLMFRSFEFTGNLLEAVQSIAETFGALIVYNTHNKTIDFIKPEESGKNKGLEVTREKLLKSIVFETDTSSFCTRLTVTGKDGISINEVSSTGTSYLENYGYFIRPFARDNQGNVITHATHMSDSLAAAILDYEELKVSKEGQFTSLLTELTSKRSSLISRTSEMADLQTQLKVIIDSSDAKQKNGLDNSVELTQKANKIIEITNKQNQINGLLQEINTTDDEIVALSSELSVDNNFTDTQLLEWDSFIIYGQFSNEYVSDPTELKKLAEEYFKSILEPQIIVEIDIVDLIEVFEFQNSSDIDKLVVGDIINIKYDLSNINIKAKITGIKTNFESRSVTLTISNVIKNMSDEEKFVKSIYSSISTANTFNQQKWAYDKAVNQADEVSQLLSETWSALDREIAGGINESVTIGRRGIIVTDIDDPNRLVIIQNSVIGLSKDGGDHFSTALSPDGIIGERIIGQIIASNNLIVTNSAGSVTIDSNGINVTDMNLILTRKDNKSRILLDPTNGLKIQSSINGGSTWTDKIYANTDGDLTVTGIINATSGTFSGNITASGVIQGGEIRGAEFNFGNIKGTTITGSTIQTSASTYPRIVLNSSENLLSAFSTPTNSVNLYSYYNGDAPAILFKNDSAVSFIQVYNNNLSVYAVSGNLSLSSNYDLLLNAGSGNKIVVPEWADFYSKKENQSLKSVIDYLQQSVSEIWTALAGKAALNHSHSVSIPNHDHGNPDNMWNGGGTFTVR